MERRIRKTQLTIKTRKAKTIQIQGRWEMHDIMALSCL